MFLVFSCGPKQTGEAIPNHPAFKDPAVLEISEKLQDKPDARLYYQRGLLLHRMGEDTLALNDFKKAAKMDSTRGEYFSAVGDLMFEHKDINGSLPYLQRAVTLNPTDPTAHLKIAKLFIYLKDYTKAFAEINTVLRQNTMTPEGYFLKGLIYKDLKDTARAISSFQTAQQVDPEYKDPIIQLGLLYSARKDPQALKYFDNAFRIDSSDVFPLYARGMFYQEQENYEQAKAEFTRCIMHDANYADAFFGIGWVLLQQDSLEKARKHFDIVTRLEPTSATAYYNRGLCNELMGNRAEAVSDYRQALTFNEEYDAARQAIARLGSK